MTTYHITDRFPSAILGDFHLFLNYFRARPRTLTKNRHFLSRRDLQFLNQQLAQPASGVTGASNQPLYTELHLFYFLARNSRLFTIDLSGNKIVWQPNEEHLAAFYELNATEQYFYLFKTLWMYSDWEEIQVDVAPGSVFPGAVDAFFTRLAQPDVKPDRPMDLTTGNWQQYLFSVYEILQYLELFGWWTCTPLPAMPESPRSFRPIQQIILTPFGKAMVDRIANVALPGEWNFYFQLGAPFEPWLEEFGIEEIDDLTLQEMLDEFAAGEKPGEEPSRDRFGALPEETSAEGSAASDPEAFGEEWMMDEEEENEADRSPMEAYFRDLFPLGELGKVEVIPPVEFRPGCYRFQVYLKFEPDIWRIVDLDAHHTLEDLHLIIQEAFDFDNDHLYAFYLNDQPFSKIAINDERGDNPPFASDVHIGDLGLPARTQILYLFDFGDPWEIEVLLLDIDPDTYPLTEPVIREVHGDSPPQYMDWDEDEEEW